MKTVAGLEREQKRGIANLFGKSFKLEQKLEELKDGERPQAIRTVVPFEIKSLNDEERTIQFVGSTAAVDRYGDVIQQSGWDLGNFLKNPVVPWGHNYAMPPVAKALEVSYTNSNLTFKAQFATADEYDWADTIYKLYKGGYLRAFSVGFIPLEYEGNWEDGYTFTKCELLEVSCVTVPANPEALVLAFKDGTLSDRDRKYMVGQAEKLIKSLTEDDQTANNKGMEKQVEELTKAVATLTGVVSDLQKGIEPLKNLAEQKSEDSKDKPAEDADGGTDDDELELDEDELKSIIGGTVKDAVDYEKGKISE